MKQVAVIGAKGMLGQEVCDKLSLLQGVSVLALDIGEIDITSRESIEACAGLVGCDTIINCAAYTNVEKAEDEEGLAFAINGEGVKNLAGFAAGSDAFLVHVSTDFVFDGKAGSPYFTQSETNPLSAYGRTKLAGEVALKESDCRFAVVRTAWLYGPRGKNFVETMLTLAEKFGKLEVVCDQVGSPTLALDLADVLIEIAQSRADGFYHCTNGGQASWHQFACEIVKQAELDVPVFPITTEETEEKFSLKATRPAYSVLDLSKTEALVGRPMREWKEALSEYLRIRS